MIDLSIQNKENESHPGTEYHEPNQGLTHGLFVDLLQDGFDISVEHILPFNC